MRVLMNRVANPLVTLLLRSPAHPVLSGRLLLLTYTGRRTGKRITLPVQYADVMRPEGRTLVVVPAFAERKRWWRNLVPRNGRPTPVRVRVRGARFTGAARALTSGGPEVVALLQAYVARYPRAARGLGVPASAAADHPAWRAAAERQVVVMVTLPRPVPTYDLRVVRSPAWQALGATPRASLKEPLLATPSPAEDAGAGRDDERPASRS